MLNVNIMSLYQLLVPLLACIMLISGASRYRRHEKTLREFLGWIVVWVGLALVAVFPHPIVRLIEQVTGIKSGLNAIIFFCLVVLFYAVFRLMMQIERLEQSLTELVRKEALKDAESAIKNAKCKSKNV
jgi:hypothetical protein